MRGKALYAPAPAAHEPGVARFLGGVQQPHEDGHHPARQRDRDRLQGRGISHPPDRDYGPRAARLREHIGSGETCRSCPADTADGGRAADTRRVRPRGYQARDRHIRGLQGGPRGQGKAARTRHNRYRPEVRDALPGPQLRGDIQLSAEPQYDHHSLAAPGREDSVRLPVGRLHGDDKPVPAGPGDKDVPDHQRRQRGGPRPHRLCRVPRRGARGEGHRPLHRDRSGGRASSSGPSPGL